MTRAEPASRARPILVTGMHRSGTKWLGRMLAASGEAAYVNEPLNVDHPRGILAVPVDSYYTYITHQNEHEYLAPFRDTLALRYRLVPELAALRSAKQFARMWQRWARYTCARLRGRRPLLRDPFAIVSAPWFARRLGCEVVVVVRHPLAVVSSAKRLSWRFDFRHLLRQDLLMRDLLSPFRAEMEAMITRPPDVVAQNALLWKVLYHAASEHLRTLPDARLVRHEDLSIAPLGEFERLYAQLGLSFSARARDAIERSSASTNPSEMPRTRSDATKLDSVANLTNWRHRLRPDEVSEIRSVTTDVAARFYPDGDRIWERAEEASAAKGVS